MHSAKFFFKFGSVLLLLHIILTVFADAPCPYSETVDLTGITPVNGSYLYNGIIVPENRTGKYNYRIEFGVETPSETHLRGCFCDSKPCIPFCCEPGFEFNNLYCEFSLSNASENVNITLKDNTILETSVYDQFAIQYSNSPCKDLYFLEGEDGQYELFENGSLLRSYDQRLMAKHEYCLSPFFDEYLQQYIFKPLNCAEEQHPDEIKTVKRNAIALMISVPFMILTIIVYLIIPELRTLHGLSFCCYLGGLSVGYSILSFLNFMPQGGLSNFDCGVLGYTAYFAFMSAFFWLSVISFDLYYATHKSRSYNEMKRFRLYCLYSFGLAFIFLICTYTAQHASWISHSLKPGIGTEAFCFLNGLIWGPLIYFYGPILIIVSFNSVMFVLTALQVKRGIALVGSNNTHKTYHDYKNLFLTFLRLFVIMGIIWCTETLSYLTPMESPLHSVFDVVDFLNGLQGIIIFVLFVLRKTVREQILKKLGRNDEIDLDHTEELDERL